MKFISPHSLSIGKHVFLGMSFKPFKKLTVRILARDFKPAKTIVDETLRKGSSKMPAKVATKEWWWRTSGCLRKMVAQLDCVLLFVFTDPLYHRTKAPAGTRLFW